MKENEKKNLHFVLKECQKSRKKDAKLNEAGEIYNSLENCNQNSE